MWPLPLALCRLFSYVVFSLVFIFLVATQVVCEYLILDACFNQTAIDAYHYDDPMNGGPRILPCYTRTNVEIARPFRQASMATLSVVWVAMQIYVVGFEVILHSCCRKANRRPTNLPGNKTFIPVSEIIRLDLWKE